MPNTTKDTACQHLLVNRHPFLAIAGLPVSLLLAVLTVPVWKDKNIPNWIIMVSNEGEMLTPPYL